MASAYGPSTRRLRPSRTCTRKRGVVAGKEVFDRMLRFAANLKRRGVLVATESLISDDRSVRVQVREGRSRLVDGPYAEAKEMVGGFFLRNGERQRIAA